jgi:hypothetical protein
MPNGIFVDMRPANSSRNLSLLTLVFDYQMTRMFRSIVMIARGESHPGAHLAISDSNSEGGKQRKTDQFKDTKSKTKRAFNQPARSHLREFSSAREVSGNARRPGAIVRRSGRHARQLRLHGSREEWVETQRIAVEPLD